MEFLHPLIAHEELLEIRFESLHSPTTIPEVVRQIPEESDEMLKVGSDGVSVLIDALPLLDGQVHRESLLPSLFLLH